MTLPIGMEIFAIGLEPDGIELAKAHCTGRGLTSDDVRIVKRDGFVVVILKREIE